MKKILLIGNDIHLIRYVNVIIFNDNFDVYILDELTNSTNIALKYNIKQYNYNTTKNLNFFDYILYTTPLGFSLLNFNRIKDYNGILLLEKSQFRFELIDLLKCKVYIIHLRDFNSHNSDVNLERKNEIKWPYINNDQMHPIYHTLPNILDYINCIIKTNNDFNIIQYSKQEQQYKIKLEYNNIIFNILIYNDNGFDLPAINGQKICWPNYYESISRFLNYLLIDNLDYKYSLEREKKYKKIICEME